MEPAVEQIALDEYDAILLGGDLTANTSREDSTLEYIDAIFDLSAETTLLAVGNHDVDDLDRLASFTQKPTFYSHTQDGITFVVFDTQKDQCSIKGDQLAMLQNIVDTFTSDQLVIIHHKLLWMPDHPIMDAQIAQVSNAGFCVFEFCLFQNNFWDDVYPLLLKVKSSGKEVLLIGGDAGFRTKFFEYETPEGIHMLASGINEGDDDNQVVVLKKDGDTKVLMWESVLLDEL